MILVGSTITAVQLINLLFTLIPKNFKKFTIEHGNVVWGKNWDMIFPIEQLYRGFIA